MANHPYGPKDSLFVTPEGAVYRYKATYLAGWTDKEQREPYYTHDFELFENRPNKNRNRVIGTNVFALPVGTVRMWTP
jgi:hypothetical protein